MKYFLSVLCVLLVCIGNAHAGEADEHFNIGVGHYERQNYVDAVGPLSEAIEASPMWAEAHQYLGRALLKLGRWVEAVENLSRAYDLMPDHKKAQFWRELWHSIIAAFTSLLDLGEVDKALAVLEDGWQLSAEHPPARDELLTLLVSQGARFLEEGRLEEWLSLLQDQPKAKSESVDTIAI